MKICLIVSLLLHVILLFAIQKAFPLHWKIEKLRTYKVEFIRPPTDDLDLTNLPSTLINPSKNHANSETQKGQDTISLDTKDKRYVTYTTLLKEKIMYHWNYPPEARLYLLEGTLTILFRLARDGSLVDIVITEASGHEILDKEVLKAISNAAPFPPFPVEIKVKQLNINARFDYQLNN